MANTYVGDDVIMGIPHMVARLAADSPHSRVAGWVFPAQPSPPGKTVTGIHGKYSVLSNFNQNLEIPIYSHVSDLIKIDSVADELLQARTCVQTDRQTGMAKLTGTVLQLLVANATKNEQNGMERIMSKAIVTNPIF